MSPHLTHRGTGVQLQYSGSTRATEPVIIAGEGPFDAATVTPTGQALVTGQPVLYVAADAPTPADRLSLAVGGDTAAHRVMLAQPTTRVGLSWVAGARGKPGINADILNAAEATRMVTDPDFEVLGTNASSDDVTFHPEGGILLTTDGADGDEVILLPHLDANQTAWTQWTWGTDKEVAWGCVIETGASINNCIVWAGLKLTNTEVVATDAEHVYFRYENAVNSGKWKAQFSVGGVDDADDSGVTVAVSTRYHLQIVIDASRIARFYIDGVLVGTSDALTDATDLIPYIGVAADGAAEAKTLVVYRQDISRTAG